ncbi:succinyl-diaminopimelate desuccinylase [Herbidospora galbida]|uniref:Succinyl-diaminopimelate desuccinylase n=1 Tax=Herbidospora galbida TaxID=2575442 RepID=A0A4U3M977_9ACTN|nr:succinyl-diaminopimelate desuccinylase [Herbidospora galbida]TKK85461.1 succinyl-diaminopimelate desuccinylase [Herbidospora galbida]
MRLDQDVRTLTADLVDVRSESGDEQVLADAIDEALRRLPHLTVDRHGNNVVARTNLGRAERVVVAGHLDTVPIADNVPSRVEGNRLIGCGGTDMKAGVAVQLKLALLSAPNRDLTLVFYDLEEVEAARNGLGLLVREHPDWVRGDFAVLMEPTDGVIEGGCQGTIRAEILSRGVRAHSARSWLGFNAIHGSAEILNRLAGYTPREPVVDGLAYHEGLNAVLIRGGHAGNVIPDECVVTVNYRFAPDLTEEQAQNHLREVFDGFEVTITDSAPGARPGLEHPVAAAFTRVVGGEPRAKVAWTDVARFSALGVPAVNYGPGDPAMAHKVDEYVELDKIVEAERVMTAWLT